MSADVEYKYKQVAARAALQVAGVPEPRLKHALRLLDYDQLDLDDGELTGLDKQLEGLREDWPEMFGEAEKPTEVEDAGPEEVDLARLTETERQVIAMMSKSSDRTQIEAILDKYRTVKYDPSQGWQETDDNAILRHLTSSQQQVLTMFRASGQHENARKLLDQVERDADPATREILRGLRPSA